MLDSILGCTANRTSRWRGVAIIRSCGRCAATVRFRVLSATPRGMGGGRQEGGQERSEVAKAPAVLGG